MIRQLTSAEKFHPGKTITVGKKLGVRLDVTTIQCRGGVGLEEGEKDREKLRGVNVSVLSVAIDRRRGQGCAPGWRSGCVWNLVNT